jgi:hypothetical protein
VALAALRRALGPTHVRLQPCWAAVQCLMVADTAQPLRTWALHALGLLVKGMSLGVAAGGHTQDALQTLDTMLEIMEAHFLAPWATSTLSSQSHASIHSQASASDNEVGLLVALARLFTALLPAVLELELSREEAGGEDDGGRLLKKFKVMWRVLAAHPDDRVALECCRALELLALFRPHDPWLAAPQTVGLLRLVLQGGHAHRRLAAAIDPFLPSDVVTTPTSVSAHLLSPAACAAALSCVRALAKRHASALRRQRMEVSDETETPARERAKERLYLIAALSIRQTTTTGHPPRRL